MAVGVIFNFRIKYPRKGAMIPVKSMLGAIAIYPRVEEALPCREEMTGASATTSRVSAPDMITLYDIATLTSDLSSIEGIEDIVAGMPPEDMVMSSA